MAATTLAASSDIFLPPLNADSVALTGSLQVKAAQGVLYSCSGYKVTANEFIQVHDKATIPLTGDVPALVLPILVANGNYSFGFNELGRRFTKGIWVVTSTTGPTFTAGATDAWVNARFM